MLYFLFHIFTISSNRVVSGTTYTRWGHDSCPSTASLIYKGSMAGSWFEQKGNGANHLCLPFDPEYIPDIGNSDAQIYGSEYESVNQINSGKRNIQNRNIPCAVCRVEMRATSIMLPARYTCPRGWTREYKGFLMASYHSQRKSEYVCVDSEMRVLPGHAEDKDGNLLYSVGAICNYGLDCPPYLHDKPLTCSVCSK